MEKKESDPIKNERRNGISEEKKLELRLGPPGEAQSIHYVGLNNKINGAKRVWQETVVAKKEERKWLSKNAQNQYQDLSFTEKTVERVFPTSWSSASLHSSAFHMDTQKQNQQPKPTYIQYPSISRRLSVMAEESQQTCGCRVAEMQNSDKKACSSRPASASVSTATAEPINSQKRIAVAPVVGWPPIRSFRKNLGSRNFSKPAPKSPNETPKAGSDGEKLVNLEHHMFVKINMDGVPIGRKVDLKVYDSYEKLSFAIDELFGDLLAAQRDYSAAKKENKVGDAKAITDSLHDSGEYTLIYEDNEGDRMLVGDVPWHMFVSTVKRLRVLMSSEISTLRLTTSQDEKTPL
ncbi:auxin-responsive protein IAA26-like [Quercus robur]|uniref:auxin-responsive protein IAA26-like n=1 Tax=Quercus robur TaxID=38942 RepID=UPI002162A916|nr:auxin-responsive protein IAA26-like [Quercus robur]